MKIIKTFDESKHNYGTGCFKMLDVQCKQRGKSLRKGAENEIIFGALQVSSCTNNKY